MRKIEVILVFAILFSIIDVNALYVPDNNQARFGHVMTIKSTNMSELSPGETGIISFILRNNGDRKVSDIEIKLRLPNEFEFYEDVSKIKVSELDSGGEKEINYQIVALPSAKEGIYSANLTIDYISNYGVQYINVGEAQQDVFDLGLAIKSDPSIFITVDESSIYNGNGAGTVDLKVINNGTIDVKFLTINLREAGEYKILNDQTVYIGDIESDDFQNAVFNLKLNGEYQEIVLPVELNYKDSLNRAYSKNVNVKLKIPSKSELKVTNNYYYLIILVSVIILIIVIIVIYLRGIKRRR
jgi:hypothetical protein